MLSLWNVRAIKQNAELFIKQNGGDTTLMPTSAKQTLALCETILALHAVGEQQILDEANRRYPQDGTHRRAFIEGAGWGLKNRDARPTANKGGKDATVSE